MLRSLWRWVWRWFVVTNKKILVQDPDAVGPPEQTLDPYPTLAEVLNAGNDSTGIELVVSTPAPFDPAIASITLVSQEAEANADRLVTASTSGEASAKTRATADDGDADVSAVALANDGAGEADATTLAQSVARKVGMTAVATGGVGVLGFYDGGVDGTPSGTGALGTVMAAVGDGSAAWSLVTAVNVAVDGGAAGLSSNDVQAAIAEIVARIEALETP